ncbi:unnamed protein product [Didymodactylos carnosus]|uniref:Hermes trasposase DNA-binding domain-containing protein n=1 Tax=Didymodactylos carnosus TaxID=1234261 RepID=A0A814WGY9_9BILA|nr:unnamed protein product [Didymodactylos carnosus]CAF1414165.1 unnamed protein product [Didymodactylos carnosus]CAF3966643.1 unnamed protein product [Didymodactylos carnosus]CAF4217286.1 unnamed protein product [Didymodactylos carnosus]
MHSKSEIEQFIKILKWKASDGTNCLKKHENCKDKRSSNGQQQILRFYKSNDNFNIKHLKLMKNRIITAAAELSALDDRPFIAIEGDGFKNLAQELMTVGRVFGKSVPVELILPHSTTVSREIDKIYERRHEQLISLCQTLTKFAVTVDFWTEEYTGVGYGGVTLHFHHNKFGLQSVVLACKAYHEPAQQSYNIRKLQMTYY